MKISVVLSSYNGEKYIIEQLISIEGQTRKPDEVLVIDDCSTDNTFNIVRDFIEKNKLYNSWKVTRNSYNRGWRKNFREAVYSAKGDLIFTCDQDDIWMNNKIEICENEMEKNGSIDVLFSNYIMFGARHKKVGKNNYMIKKYNYHKNFFRNCAGCVMCIRKSFAWQIEKYWKDTFPHDSVLYRFAILQDGLYHLNAYLIQWRIHEESSYVKETEKKDLLYRENWLNYAEQIVSEMLIFCKENEISNRDKKLHELNKYNKWISLRRKFTVDCEWWSGIKLLNYYSCYPYKIQFFSDWLFYLQNNIL